MKNEMTKYISLLESSEYNSHEAVNQSTLKKILIHPVEYQKSLNRKEELITKDYLVLGSLVDCLIFEPELLNQNFAVISEKEPPNQINNFILFVIGNESIIEEEELFKAALKFTEAKNRTVEYFVSQMNDTYAKYTAEIRNSVGKTQINSDMLSKAHNIVDSIKQYPMFQNIMTAQNKNEEVIYQACIVFPYKNELFKAKLDCIKINHANRLITPSDLKTTFKYASLFVESYYEYEYDFQSAFYNMAIKYFRDMNYPDYNIDTFKFVVESTSNIGTPCAFQVSQDALESGMLKVEEAINELAYCKKVNSFSRKRIEEEGNKLLTI